jgi:TPR repeat protein
MKMRHWRAVVCAILTSIFTTTSVVGEDNPPSAAEPAIAGIGEALPPLSDRARQKFTARAEAGDLDAMYELAHHALWSGDGPMGGQMYYWGRWNNPKESERWWRKAAALGDPKAMILLGHMYAEPWGVPQSIEEGAHWFKQAADLNSLEAVQALVDLYIGAWSDERDDAAANQWLTRAESMGDRHAMLLVGLRYDAGWGIREDPAEAAHWYEKLIAGGWNKDYSSDLNTAWNNLGALYEQGRGEPRDESKAAEFYGKAARGWSAATYNLAVLCESGRGVQQDKAAAAWLYREAAMREVPEAIAALKRLGFKIPATAKEQEDEATALQAHDKEKRTKTACDP